MKCVKCQEELAANVKFCPHCGNPVPREAATGSSGVSVGDVGYLEGNITDASRHGAASVGSINVHVGNGGANGKSGPETEIVVCPLCGRRNHLIDTFLCNTCGKDYICLTHQDPDLFMCRKCALEVSGAPTSSVPTPGPEKEESVSAQSPETSAIPQQVSNTIGMEFVYIEPGTFMMGSPPDEPERSPEHSDDEQQHRVTLTQGYYMQTTEVTQGQWRAVMGNNPSGFKDCGDNCPVEQVSWYDVQEFIQKLNRMEHTDKYRLPTEAEWEYACRAGTETPFAFGRCLSTDQANYDGNYPLSGCGKGTYLEKTLPVGSFAPNAWGLYDMHGNVWEWCADWYGDYPSGSVTDPTGPSGGEYRVRRGGSWSLNAQHCRSAYRSYRPPGRRYSPLGFRLLRTR